MNQNSVINIMIRTYNAAERLDWMQEKIKYTVNALYVSNVNFGHIVKAKIDTLFFFSLLNTLI